MQGQCGPGAFSSSVGPLPGRYGASSRAVWNQAWLNPLNPPGCELITQTGEQSTVYFQIDSEVNISKNIHDLGAS